MAKVENAEEQTLIDRMQKFVGGYYGGGWTGMSTHSHAKHFYDASKVVGPRDGGYRNWGHGEPKGRGLREECVFLIDSERTWGGSKKLYWHTEDCSKKHPIICEKRR